MECPLQHLSVRAGANEDKLLATFEFFTRALTTYPW